MRIPFEEAKRELKRVLLTRGCPDEKADKVAHEMARNSLEGTYTHGINRFPRLIRNIDEGIVKLDVMPALRAGFGGLERYDGQLGLGVVNAWFCMDRAIALARLHGIGCVTLANTNHWQRAATYGYQACDAGMAGVCFTNTVPNMPTWGALDSRIGNNPIVLAFPREGGHIVVDMAMSQFSYGALELAVLEGRQMPIDAGVDADGNLTRDPAAVIVSRRILPTGYWKGAAMSFALDMFAACLSMGNATAGVGRLPGDEHGVSQVFIAIHGESIVPKEASEATLADSLESLLASSAEPGGRIIYTGQPAMETRAQNLLEGIPVDPGVWATIQALG